MGDYLCTKLAMCNAGIKNMTSMADLSMNWVTAPELPAGNFTYDMAYNLTNPGLKDNQSLLNPMNMHNFWLDGKVNN